MDPGRSISVQYIGSGGEIDGASLPGTMDRSLCLPGQSRHVEFEITTLEELVFGGRTLLESFRS